MYDYHTAYDPNAEDMAPTRDEAIEDEIAMRRRRPVPRDGDDNSLFAALDASTRTVVEEYRKAGVL